jgi:DNA repair exonuclease SbcCD nuclease subunit
MTPELIEFMSWVLNECAKIAKTIIIAGNHDMLENNLTRLDALTPVVDSLNNKNIVYYKNRGVYEDENINWCVYSLFEHNLPPEITKTPDKINIGLFHGPIQGLYTDIGYKFEDGYDTSKFRGCDLVLCGDIHKRQTLWLEQEMEIDENELKFYLEKGWEIF